MSPERDLLEAKLHDERPFVDRFQEAWAEVAMNLDRGPDHTMRPPVELPGRFLGVLGVLVVQPSGLRPPGLAGCRSKPQSDAAVLTERHCA